MGVLTIEKYQQEEQDAKAYLSNRFIRAFTPNTFLRGGFPDRVYKEQELVRYIDSQHSECFERYYKELCKGITEKEAELLINTAEKIYLMTKKKYETKILVKAPLLAALYCKRVVDLLSDSNLNVHIMEFGAGSGMVGALLLNAGYRYSCTDVTQAFYLVQNRILNIFSPLNELCIEKMKEEKNYHVPYWKLWEMRDSFGEVDIVTCNHALLEMSNSALLFYLRFSYCILKNSRYGYFFFQGTGWNVEGDICALLNKFKQSGFCLVYYDINSELAIFSTKGEDITKQVIDCLNNSSLCYESSKYIPVHGSVKSIQSNNNTVLFNNDIGSDIQSLLKKIELSEKLEFHDINRRFDCVCPNTDSPDEEFAKYINNFKQ